MMVDGVTQPEAKTLDDLEWHRIVRAVAERCVGPSTRREDLPIAATREGMERVQGETREARRLLESGEPLPLDGLRDVRAHLARLARQGALDGPALNDIRATLGAARSLRRFLGRRKEVAPLLASSCATDPTLDHLEDELSASLEPDGSISDRASPEVRRLRTEVANLRARMVGKLEEMVHRHADILSDRFFTIREGRYVLPLRTDAHEKIQGIVHGTSASGATVFVEPRQLIPQGNRLKMAQGELEREETRILALLSDLVRERVPELEAAADALDRADLRAASAKFGRDFRCTMVELADGPSLKLVAARHPILLLEGVDVVPNDLEIEGGKSLVISGPNAGGKTVSLKMLGLAALMVRAGLPLPCAEGSRCGFFAPVLTDVGDEQSIEKNLSSFSAHVVHLAHVLREAHRGALVVLDELAGSTDPHEGAALACAILERLTAQGAAVAVTTHYEPLKALAIADPRFRNASVGFDVAKMEPTFKLTLDLPGSSSALVVAERFGIPREVLDAARRVVPEQTRTFEDLVRRLEEKRRELDDEKSRLDDELSRATSARVEVERERERLRSRERGALSEEGERVLVDLRRARDEIERARKRIRDATTEAELREARRQAEEAAKVLSEASLRAAPSGPKVEEAVDPNALKPGDRVWVPRLRSEAEVIEAPARGKIRVAAGPMKLWVEADEISKAEARPTPAPVAPTSTRGPKLVVQTSDNTIDVRGMRVDEALAAMETFLDRLYGASEPVGFVLHGIGSGALRDALRTRLSEAAAYVREARPGTPEEGGDRITVVHLR